MQRNKKKQRESTRRIALKKREKQKKGQEQKELNDTVKLAEKEISESNFSSNKPKKPENNHHDDLCELKPENMNLLGKLFSYFTSTIITTFYVTVAYFFAMHYVIKLGYFDEVHTENGLEFYAEKAHPKLKEILPSLKMPLNTLVNMGYLNVGLIVIAHVQKLFMNKKLSNSDAAMFFIFGWSSFLYGHVQFWRIILQEHREAVMNQWITLPIFAWTVAWTCHLYYGWSLLRNISIVAVSTMSYCLTWYSRYGFEISLGLHIATALLCGALLYCTTTSKKAGRAFWVSAVMCCGFVSLKLLDLELPKYHPLFTTVSGHFLSKICDFVQIYHVSQFFMHVNIAANNQMLKTKNAKPKMD